MQIKIQKATLGGISLSYEYEQKETDVVNIIKAKSDAPVHTDLVLAFKKFIPHFAFICNQENEMGIIAAAVEDPQAYVTDKDNAPSDIFFKYIVHTIEHITKKGLNKVVLHGCRRLDDSFDEIYFKTPEIDLDDIKYIYVDDLKDLVENWDREVMAYMDGKQAPKTQIAMFEDEVEGDVQEAFAG